jgi:hypothetical protein
MTDEDLMNKIAELQRKQIDIEVKLAQIQQKVLVLQDRIGRGE